MLGSKFETVSQAWRFTDLFSRSQKASGDTINTFRNGLAELLGGDSKQAIFFKSARSALLSILTTLDDENKRVVMLCALNCSVVSDAVLACGLEPLYYDLADSTGRIDCEALAFSIPDNCCAVVIPHLYGLPAASGQDIDLIRAKGVTVVEDCAHTLGATVGGKIVGTMGDYSIFSFNHDKPISLGGGGMLWVNSSVPKGVVDPQKNQIFLLSSASEILELFWFKVFLLVRRVGGVMPPRIGSKLLRVFNVLSRILRISDGGSGFPVSGIGAIRAKLGCIQLKKLNHTVSKRNDKSSHLINKIGLPVWSGVSSKHTATWLRLRLRLPSQEKADRCSKIFRKHGLRVGRFNWPDLPTELNERDFPHAFLWAKCGVDVPLHEVLSATDLDRMIVEFNALGELSECNV